MADNQMVKIVFDFDLGNVPASAKKLSQYLKDNNLDLKFTKASVDGLSASLGQLSTQQTKAGNSAAAAGNQIKKSNMQWTNLALVLQDLPYGFRGIQNNLPALMGGFAGLTGPIYLAGSALIAFFTAWDNGMIKFGNTVKLTTDFSKEAATAYANETIQLESLYRVATDVNVSMDERLIAAQELKKEYPGLLGLYSDEDIALGKADESYKKLTTTIWQYAQVKAAEKTLEEIAIKQNALTIKKNKTLATQKERELYLYKEVKGLIQDEMTFTQRLVKTFDDLPKGPLMMVNAWGAVAKSTEILTDIEKEQQSINDEAKLYKDIIDANITSIKKLNDYTQDPEKTKARRLEDPTIKLLQAKQKYYKDDLLMFASYEEEILGRERDLAVKRAEMEGQSDEYIKTIKDTYNQLILNSQAETGRKFLEEQHKLGQEEAKEHEKVAQMILATRNKLAAAINSINEQFANKRIKEVDAELAATLRGTKGNYQAQVNAIQGAIDKLEEEAAAAAEAGQSTAAFEDKIASLKRTMEGLIDPLEQLEMNINKTFNDLATGALVELGKQIGNVFSGSNFSLNGFLSMLGDGLIQLGTYLVSISTVFLGIKKLFETGGAFAGLAIPIGLAAIATGMVIKNKLVKDNTPKFANGGIVSGPTMGLMGEYPGAQSNPEVIAPLDKLKSMIGGGGNGEFVLRGNDLVLALQRSNSSLNLRRGGI